MTPEETVDEFMARVQRMDIDGACELVHPEVEYDNVPMGKVYGPEGIKGFLGPMVDNLDGTEWVVHRQVARDRVVMNERTDRFGRNGRWAELPVVGVWEVDDEGRIVLWRDYFDGEALQGMLAALAD